MIVFPSAVTWLISALEQAGHEAWAVGGCVRDSLLGREPNDWDLCTSASPAEMEEALSGLRLLRTGEKHGTLTAMVEGVPYEITAYRTDGEYENHRRPRQVQYVKKVSEDLSRRDFTINAMAAHPQRGVLDLFGGQEDLKKGIIRCVGQPRRRFEEDSLRILRAMRFAARFGFAIEDETLKAMGERASLMLVLSAERIWNEISRLCVSPYAHQTLSLCGDLLCDVAPGLQKKNAPLLKDAPLDDLSLRLSLLFSDPRAAERTLSRLRAPRRVQDRVCLLLSETEPPQPNALWMRKALARLGEEAVRQRLTAEEIRGRLHPSCREVLEEVVERKDPYRSSMLAISGADLVLSGICPKGPLCGMVLEALLQEVMEERIKNQREDLTQEARKLSRKMAGNQKGRGTHG